MDNIYKLFYENSSLHIISAKEFQNYKNSGFYEYTDARQTSYHKLVDQFLTTKHGQYALVADNPLQLFNEIKNRFHNIEAAGGLVFNEKNELLTIKRRGKNDLPKGKCEKNENIEETALREVMEECGIKNLSIKKTLNSTYHIYPAKKMLVLKKTHWFEMRAPDQPLTPQTEEEIEYTTWTPINKLYDFAANTYPTLIDLLKSCNLI